MTTYVYVLEPEPAHKPTPAELECIDRFLAAFVAKKGVTPGGHWKVPGVGYCLFSLSPFPNLERQ